MAGAVEQVYRSLLGALIANLQDGVLAEDERGRVVVANHAFSRMFGLSAPDALMHGSASELRHTLSERAADPESDRRRMADLIARGQPHIGFDLRLDDGRILDGDYVPVPAPDGTTVHMWHYRDVTDRRQLERRLREASGRLRALSAHAEETREAERRELARTLHDELGQLFSSIRLELSAAIELFRASQTPSLRPVVDRLQALAGLTDVGLASLRRITTTLRPPVLDHLGLVDAVRWEASLFSKRTGIRCHVRARPASLALDDARITALYRILLAALDNISRHAAAGTAWIHLTRQRGLTTMEVRDNGRGITEAQINDHRTMGLLAMRERALALGGEVRVTGARRRGTRVLVILPDNEEAGPARRAVRSSRVHA
jgi:PAS domain S-box-containing protein